MSYNHPCHELSWSGHIKIVKHDWGPWIQRQYCYMQDRTCLKQGCGKTETRTRAEELDEKILQVPQEDSGSGE